MDKLAGWLSPEVATAMRCLIRETKPKVMVEIGVYAGKSLINAALQLKENGKGVIYGIDPWNMDDALQNMGSNEHNGFWSGIDLNAIHLDCINAIREAELDNVVLIQAPSERCHQLFRKKSVDILYIDGGHSEPQSCRDVTNYTDKVKRGGYIWFDDVEWESTQKAVGMLQEQCTLSADFGNAHLYIKQ